MRATGLQQHQAPQPTARPRRRLGLGLAVAVGLSLAAAGVMGPELWSGIAAERAAVPETSDAVPMRVIVQYPLFEAHLTARRFVAVVAARIQTPHAFQVPGRIEARLVENGQMVRAGQPLARLVQDDFQLSRDQAAAEVSAATEALRVAREEARRFNALRESGNASAARLDATQGALREAQSRLDRASALLASADNTLGYATLTAQFDGLVVDPQIEAGQVIAAGVPVMTLAQLDQPEAVLALPEGQPLPAPGAEARFLPWSDTSQPIPARLREISPSADPLTHTFTARFALQGGAAAGLRLGSTGHLLLPQQAGGDALIRVPGSALYDAGTGDGVGLWRVGADDRLELVPVEVAEIIGADALIRAALQPQDRIVTLGANRLQAGLPVDAVLRAAE